MMLKTNTLTPPMAARRPHEVISLLRGMHSAVKILLDPRATLPETEEMYAVFEEKSAVCALTALFVGFARYASINTLTAEEQPRKIFLHLKGDRRTGGNATCSPRGKRTRRCLTAGSIKTLSHTSLRITKARSRSPSRFRAF